MLRVVLISLALGLILLEGLCGNVRHGSVRHPCAEAATATARVTEGQHEPLVIVATNYDELWIQRLVKDKSGQPGLINVERLDAHKWISEYSLPTWSPDGRKVAWWTGVAGRHQLRAKALGGAPHILYTAGDYANISSPQWSPDSAFIFFIKSSGWVGEVIPIHDEGVWRVPWRGGALKQVVPGAPPDLVTFDPCLSPDGRWMAVWHWSENAGNLALFDCRTGVLRDYPHWETGASNALWISKHQLVFGQLSSMAIATGAVVSLSFLGGGDYDRLYVFDELNWATFLAWRPPLLAIATEEGKVALVNRRGQLLKRFTLPFKVEDVSFPPQGGSLWFASSDGDLYQVDLEHPTAPQRVGKGLYAVWQPLPR